MSGTQEVIFTLGSFGTVVVGLFIAMWIVSDVKTAGAVIGWMLAAVTAVVIVMTFWYWVAGGFA